MELKEQQNNQNNIKLDYSIESAEERTEFVKKIIAEAPPGKLTKAYLETLADYIIFAADKAEKKEKKILTDNRMVTVNKREISYQELVGKMQQGEDGIYNMITNDKNIIFKPRVCITEKDYQDIPELRELRESIKKIEELEKKATGRRRFLLKQQLIEMHKDAYIIKNAFRKPIYFMNVIKSIHQFSFNEDITIDADGTVKSNGIISLYNPNHISALLCNYSKLKQESWGNFNSDIFYLMEDLDNLIENTLSVSYPFYYDLVIYKIDGKSNIEIQKLLEEKHGVTNSVEYLSSLWRNKIPKLLAEKAQENYLLWYYTYQEKGKWKKCNRCGQIKLAHNRFFSKNNTSKDGWYSICKECRNKKRRGE